MLLEYTGKARFERCWPGPTTGVDYRFGGDRRVGWVDARDGVKLLTPRRSGEAVPVFRVAQ